MVSSAGVQSIDLWSDGALDYPSIVADSADVTIVLGSTGEYLYVSPACHRVFGWDPCELDGHCEDEFVHPDDAATLRVRRAERGQPGSASTSFRFLCSDDTYRWVEATSRVASSPAARP